jgi:hypothetical protein
LAENPVFDPKNRVFGAKPYFWPYNCILGLKFGFVP